jgi:hypothetical protein
MCGRFSEGGQREDEISGRAGRLWGEQNLRRKREGLQMLISEQTISPPHLAFAHVFAQYVWHKISYRKWDKSLGR